MKRTRRPVIGITTDRLMPDSPHFAPPSLPGAAPSVQASPEDGERAPRHVQRDMCRSPYFSRQDYTRTVIRAGGLPILLPQRIDLIEDYLELCDGIVLTGGDDLDMTSFGEATHPACRMVHPHRQAFELALVKALDRTAHPVLGICLGMQVMVMHHGGRLHQHMPDDVGPEIAARHGRSRHRIQTVEPIHPILPPVGEVQSYHHQAVADPGRLRVCARCPDGVIEAVELPGSDRFYLGVQWHPERTVYPPLGVGMLRALVRACGQAERAYARA